MTEKEMQEKKLEEINNKLEELDGMLKRFDFHYEKCSSMSSPRYIRNNDLEKQILREIALADGVLQKMMTSLYNLHSIEKTGITMDWEWLLNPTPPQEPENFNCTIPWISIF